MNLNYNPWKIKFSSSSSLCPSSNSQSHITHVYRRTDPRARTADWHGHKHTLDEHAHYGHWMTDVEQTGTSVLGMTGQFEYTDFCTLGAFPAAQSVTARETLRRPRHWKGWLTLAAALGGGHDWTVTESIFGLIGCWDQPASSLPWSYSAAVSCHIWTSGKFMSLPPPPHVPHTPSPHPPRY